MPIDQYILDRLKANDPTLTQLEFRGSRDNRLTDNDIKLLVEALTHNTALTQLDVSSNQIGAAGAQALAQNTTLTRLNVSSNYIGAAGAQALAQNTILTSLAVSDNEIGDVGAQVLAQNTTLTQLNVSSNQIGEAGAQALALNKALIQLNVGSNQIGAAGAQALAQNTALTQLDVTYTQIGNAGALALAQNTTLAQLNVSNNQISAAGAQALAQNTTLTQLNMSRNQIGDIGAQALAQNTTLAQLDVSANQIGNAGAQALAQNTTLAQLDVSNNEIGAAGAQALAQNMALAQLNIRHNEIGDAGVEALAQNTTLAQLNVSWNRISDVGAQALAQNTTLAQLDMRDNQISDAGAQALAQNTTFVQLAVDNNQIGATGQKALDAARQYGVPFLTAAQHGDIAALQQLVSQVLFVNPKSKTGKTALQLACEHGHLEALEVLLKVGAKATEVDRQGNTLLHLAAQAGQKHVVQFLLAQGANRDMENHQKQRPRDLALQAGHFEVAQQLFQLGTGRTEQAKYTPVGDRYGLVNKISLEQAVVLKKQTGITLKFEPGKTKTRPTLGQGAFGKLRLAVDLKADTDTPQFVAVKKIKGQFEIESSKQEAFLQWQLNDKPNVLPLLDSVETVASNKKPVLYQFMPLASFGSGEHFMRYLAEVNKTDTALRNKLFIHTFKGFLTGVAGMHQVGMYHLDIKPSNFLIDHEGTGYVADFGCAQKVEGINNNPTEPKLSEALGDTNYFSPDRVIDMRFGFGFQPAKADSWAVGLSALEMLLGYFPFQAVDLSSRQQWMPRDFEAALQVIFEDPALMGSQYASVLRGLLAVDPGERLSVEDALQAPLFQASDYRFASDEERKAAFQALKELALPSSATTPLVDKPKTQDERYQLAKTAPEPAHVALANASFQGYTAKQAFFASTANAATATTSYDTKSVQKAVLSPAERMAELEQLVQQQAQTLQQKDQILQQKDQLIQQLQHENSQLKSRIAQLEKNEEQQENNITRLSMA